MEVCGSSRFYRKQGRPQPPVRVADETLRVEGRKTQHVFPIQPLCYVRRTENRTGAGHARGGHDLKVRFSG